MDIMNDKITLRVSKKMRKQFERKAEEYGRPSVVHRELLQAFIEDRLIINAPERSLYNGD